MSTATVVSVCNYPVGPEFKPGLFPRTYEIPAATGHFTDSFVPGVLIIEDGFHDIPQLDYKTIRVTVPAIEIARSVVNDYCTAQLQVSEVALPGMFALDSGYQASEVVVMFENELGAALERHTAWCRNLVKMGDDLWNISKQSRHISTTMRNAAKFLQLQREWLSDATPIMTAKCPACFSIIEQGASICKHCHAVLDKERAAQFSLA